MTLRRAFIRGIKRVVHPNFSEDTLYLEMPKRDTSDWAYLTSSDDSIMPIHTSDLFEDEDENWREYR